MNNLITDKHLEVASRTLKVFQVVTLAFALAQFTIVLAIA